MYTLKFTKLAYSRANFIFYSGVIPVLILATNATSFSNAGSFLLSCVVSFLIASVLGSFAYSENTLRATIIVCYSIFYTGVFFSLETLGTKQLSFASIGFATLVGVLLLIALFAPVKVIDGKTNVVFPKGINLLLKDSKIVEYLYLDCLSQRKLSAPTEEQLTKILNILEAEKSLMKKSDNYDKVFYSLANKLDKIISSLEISYKNNEKDEVSINNEVNERLLELVESTD